MGKDSILTAELITCLNSKNVYFLFQASCAPMQGSICPNWLVSTELGLEGDYASTWDRYRASLIRDGISIFDRQDELRWTGGDSYGMITTKNVYNALASKLWKNKIRGWRRNLWGWDFPQKIKLFAWLLIEDKLLTWNNLQKRGWVGPRFCHLSKDMGNLELIFLCIVLSLALYGKISKRNSSFLQGGQELK